MGRTVNHVDDCVGVAGGAAITLFFACHAHIIKAGTQIMNLTQLGSTQVELAELAVAKLEPIAAEMRRLMASADYIDEVLRKGAERAAGIAEPNLAEIKKIIGLLNP